MDLINQIFIAIVLTALTGMIACKVLQSHLDGLFKWRPDLAYTAVRCVCILYTLPIGFVLLKLTIESKYMRTDEIWNHSFAMTGILRILVFVAALFWLAATVKAAVQYIRKNMQWFEVLRGNIPEDDEVAMEEFIRIKKKLKLHGYIRLRRNDLLPMPLTSGIIVPTVILPYRRYNREQLRVILYHELTHCRNHDVFFKLSCIYIKLVTHMNSQTELLMDYVKEFSECNCDADASEAMKDEVSLKGYYNVILQITDVAMIPSMYPMSMLCEGQTCLERRINYMKFLETRKKTAKVAAFGLSTMFMLLGVTTTYAAGVPLASFQDWLYQKTEVVSMESQELPDFEEQVVLPGQDNSYDGVIYANPEDEGVMPQGLDANEMASFNWTMDSGIRYISGTFYVKSGQNIVVSASTTPASSTFWLGIMDSSGKVRYIQGSGSLSYTFPIDKSSNYRVIIQNQSSVSITSSGSYYYY